MKFYNGVGRKFGMKFVIEKKLQGERVMELLQRLSQALFYLMVAGYVVLALFLIVSAFLQPLR